METSFYQTKSITSEKLPLVMEAKKEISFETFLEFLQEERAFIKEKLLIHGGVLLRGFPVRGAEDFHRTIEVLEIGKLLNYVGGDSPREKVKGKVYTSTEAPADLKIPLHNEMSFIKNFPKHICFYCETPALGGGETILADARQVLQSMEDHVKKPFIEKGLQYVSNYYGKSTLMDLIKLFRRGHKSWMEVFETEEKKEAEQKCEDNFFSYSWGKNDWLQVCQTCPAIQMHPVTKENVWFNQAHLYDLNPKLIGKMNWLFSKLVYLRKNTAVHEIYFADGQKIPRKDLYYIMDVLDKNTLAFPWKRGDVLILDNMLAMHGRAPFSGKRRVLAALTR